MISPESFNARGAASLPGHLGIHIISVSASEVRSELSVQPFLMAMSALTVEMDYF